jgi:hypothetical protein
MERVGYDADTEVFTYQDSDGYYYQGEPGTRYGLLRPTGTRGFREQYTVTNACLYSHHLFVDDH